MRMCSNHKCSLVKEIVSNIVGMLTLLPKSDAITDSKRFSVRAYVSIALYLSFYQQIFMSVFSLLNA